MGAQPRPVRKPAEPVDPDVDLHVPAERRQSPRDLPPVVAAVALGGGIGAAARHGASHLWPTAPGDFPWPVLAVNVAGCAMLGVLMVVVTEVRPAHRLLRPFLGTGVLGGFTTFSAYAAGIEHLVDSGRARSGLAYLLLTLLAALAAVRAAVSATRRACRAGA